MKKVCLDCGEILKGRIDKKFCSDSCRNNYNNKQNRDATNFVRNINNTLRKNRAILEKLIPDKTTKVHHQKLENLGFNFNYFTSTYTTKNQQTYYFCYEYGYLPLDKEMYVLVMREH